MKVKQYRAVTLQEAFAQAQAELGEDAVLLHQKEVSQPTRLGRRASTLVEITVGVDEPEPRVEEARPLFTPQPARPLSSRITDQPATRPTPFFAHTASSPAQKQDEFASLRRELAHIRSLLQRRSRGENDQPEALAAWSDALHTCALPAAWIDRLLDGLDEMLTPAALGRADMVSAALMRRMVAELETPTGALQPGRPGQPLVFLLVGPTGVGKTTTIAKLAAHYALQKRLPIALITADTFRIGAVNQLRTYSELLQAPLDVAYTPPELAQLVHKHRDKALIFVDTPGRSPTDREQLTVLESFVAAVDNPHLLIALAAGTLLVDARRIVDRFSIIPPQGVVLTKIDETSHFGPAYTLLAERHLPLSYFTTGQRVPEDIEVATNERLLDRLLRLARNSLPEIETPAQPNVYVPPSQFQQFADVAQLH